MVEEMKAEAKDSQINRPDRSQPITCALQIALVDLLASWSVYPNAVVGHSSGEIGMNILHSSLLKQASHGE